MKHSIKREQSHARMSFAECENQRSLAEGESNVRATLKHMKLSFHLILTLAAMLTMAQTAWAATEEVTETWTMNGSASSISGSTLSNGLGNRIVLSNGGGWLNNGTQTILDVNQALILTDQYSMEASFPDIEGTVTKVEFHNICLFCPPSYSYSMYVGKSMSSLLNISSGVTAFTSWNSASQFKDVTYTGTLDVSSSAPLKLLFGASSVPPYEMLMFNSGYIKVTYQREVAADPQHTFSFPNPSSFSGNTLTVTCTNSGVGHECTLTNHQATLTLTAHDNTIESFPMDYPSLNLLDFNTQTGLGATAGTITYTNKTTGVTKTGMIFETGEFMASVTITVGGNNYTLTKDFNILAGYRVNNNYLQFSLSKSSALVGDEITITYTQQMDESLDGLTLTGATSGNNIAYTQSGNTYTFTMPAEDVNLNATITYPLNENNITQSGDTYTIKTAEGWNYFCQRMEVDDDLDGFSGKTVVLGDDITVTTMAGSGKYPFKGTFDGDGHTLTFNYTADRSNCAPFCTTNGATIRNLHVTGLIEGGIWNYMGGLVGSANGKLTIENCRVSTQISSIISGTAFNGGFVGYLSSQYNQCHITGCVFDGLICNPNTWNQTYGCGGFVGSMSQYGYAILKDCLFLHGQYDNNNGKCELKWGSNDQNSTFLHRSNDYGGGTLTNCFYVGTRGLKQGSPAVESADAPDNFAHFGTPTDHGFLKVYGHTMVFDGKYYTPTYGDLVEKYDYSGRKSYNIEYDDAPLGIPDITSPLWTEGLRYNRSFTAGKPVTIMLPFNFTRDRITLAHDNANPSGKFYEFKGIEENQDHKWVAVMIEAGKTLSNEVVETTLKANTPYLYVPAESTEYWDMYVGGYGINIFTEGNEGGTKETEYYYGDGMPWNHWKFKGTYQPRYWSETEHFEEVGKVYGFAGASKWVDGKLVEAGEFVRAKVGAKIRPTSCYLKWVEPQTDNAPARALTRSAGSNNGLVLTLPEHFKILSVDGQPYTGNGQDLSQGSTIVIELEAGYSATNVVATQQSNVIRSTPPEEIPDYDDYLK